MPIVFVDERISINSNNSNGSVLLSSTPLLIGDIGLQTGVVANTTNAGNVRVALSGTVNVTGDTGLFATITLTIERNGTGTAGSGTLIYTEVFNTNGLASFSPLSITTGDFPLAAAVNAGQIRYTLFIVSSGSTTLRGPVGFNGSASAGTTG
ncbi:hypothetical protein [Paenibacillus sp. FSL R10-2734]|uniref:hypothetical protein n=1 Tax=Paenibacillus sp. FSL R10-2734 TaxID=2954691 RepID=UPI0030D718CA